MHWIPAPLRIPGFRAYWFARWTSTIGQLAMVIVIGWQVYDIARETMSVPEASFRLGIIGLVQFIPLFVLVPVSGYAADHFDRRRVGRATIGLELGCAAALGWLAWSHSTTLTALFVVAALLGVARAFSGPAFQALAPNLVPREILPTAIALSSISWQSGSIIGPALGGYLYAVSPATPYAVAAILFAISFAATLAIPPLPLREADLSSSLWRRTTEGFRYVRTNRLVLGAISLDLFAVLLGGATAMLPVFARDVLHSGAEGLGHLRAAPALGATLTAAWFTFRPMKTNVGVKMLWAVALFGAATVVFGLSTSMPLSLVSLVVLGAADMFSVNIRQSLVQLHTPDEKRGRVGAVSSLFISASNELGEAESGMLAALIGPVVAVVVGGIGAVVVVAVWAWKFPELRLAKSFDPPDMGDQHLTASDQKEPVT
ncbi:MAG: MFS transporter [Sphingomicrobium sp.]